MSSRPLVCVAAAGSQNVQSSSATSYGSQPRLWGAPGHGPGSQRSGKRLGEFEGFCSFDSAGPLLPALDKLPMCTP